MLTIHKTTDYQIFDNTCLNRTLKPAKHKRLLASMKKYGFQWWHPIVCRKSGRLLLVIGGQHRLQFAKELGLPVYYVILTERDATKLPSIPEGEATNVPWDIRDYAESNAAQGKESYQHLLEFCSQYELPVSYAASILSGSMQFGGVKDSYVNGDFEVTDLTFAKSIASIWLTIRRIDPSVTSGNLMQALAAICRVDGFDVERMTSKIERHKHLLERQVSKDYYLKLLERIYNNRVPAESQFPLAFQAQQVMKTRQLKNLRQNTLKA